VLICPPASASVSKPSKHFQDEGTIQIFASHTQQNLQIGLGDILEVTPLPAPLPWQRPVPARDFCRLLQKTAEVTVRICMEDLRFFEGM
jgi:hypothetical protein